MSAPQWPIHPSVGKVLASTYRVSALRGIGDLIVDDAVAVNRNLIGGSDTHEKRGGPRRNTLHPDIIRRRDELGHRVPTQQLDVVGDHCTERHLDRQRVGQVVLAKTGECDLAVGAGTHKPAAGRYSPKIERRKVIASATAFFLAAGL